MGGPQKGWYHPTISNYLSLKHLLIRKTNALGWGVKKLIFEESIWGLLGGVVPPNYIKLFVSQISTDVNIAIVLA